MVNEINAKVWTVMIAFEAVKTWRVLHRSRIVSFPFQKRMMPPAIIDETRLWRLRAIRMFLMTSLRFFKYFFRTTNASIDTVAQRMGNATSKPTVDLSSGLVTLSVDKDLVKLEYWI